MNGNAEKLEPAIPPHLRVARTYPLGAPEGFRPVTPSYSARFDPQVTALPMIFVGVQGRNRSSASEAVVRSWQATFQRPFGPAFRDRAEYVDELGYATAVVAAYWDDRRHYDRWDSELPREWWHQDASLDGDLGFFCERYTPSIKDTETTFSHPYPEGYSAIASHMSGMTDTHGYWGSARDRIPRSQIDAMDPTGRPALVGAVDGETLGRHVAVQPHENLCLLRSGQDWSETDHDERAFYLDEVRPALIKGMLELRDDGRRSGCFFNRFMTLVGPDGPIEKTYSLSAWHSLAAIEAWCWSDTHLKIFAAGTRHYRLAEGNANLKLYHEMSVIRAKDQAFEYFNCHRKTGMLNSLDPST
ncbi:phenylacetaldoxime dehydratase family protein [Dactylosporangium sucinum]|uniref:Phenylacetaldoxime dehydratase n=1 Tax=Dactylosporangium sucinum TaxID=1424081 RepID=A0A917TSZ6_9ACTN|nr:phenylacetaldoxime dehydratase family protein [Dactylosporangium sucinum]GGM36839.1 phenylacetaldoxime dehydratase [Dactylosporangium sucinum]